MTLPCQSLVLMEPVDRLTFCKFYLFFHVFQDVQRRSQVSSLQTAAAAASLAPV